MTESTILTRNDLLDLVIEEAAEVIQAASKCKRFGFEANNFPETYGPNHLKLAMEFGELMSCFHAVCELSDEEELMKLAVGKGMETKIMRAMEAKAKYGV